MTTYCVIVTYRPDVARLLDLCGQLVKDGAKIVLVDNTEAPYLESGQLLGGCTLITLGYNSGIAHAQNVGLRAALAEGAAVLFFFDQDSKIWPGFVNCFAAALDIGVAKVVSPLCIDDATNVPLPAVRIGRHGQPIPVHCADAAAPYLVDIVISSGIAATRSVFDAVGAFDEQLFIDFVDTEWCLRCRAKQIPIYVVPNVVMRHSIGARYFRVGPLTISEHSAERCYYQIRNCFLLIRRPHVPLFFSAKELASTLVNRFLLLFFVESRLSYLKAYLSAVRDGIKGTTGERPTQSK